ncbi:hypothetical protein GQ44DRAFT_679475 [Phaeosphaeriaceae sp. PMI808]|nr:hypothetical protein GQ44DRAFT_679475 [Phaeosphaeriaceae sp. PMI808]
MYKIPRNSLAALVCPSAPFLVPRLVRASVGSTANASVVSCAPSPYAPRSSYATATNTRKLITKFVARTPKPFRASGSQIPEDESIQLLKKLRTACDQRNVQMVMALYPLLLEAKVLNRHDIRRIAQAFHAHARVSPTTIDTIPFIQRMVEDMRNGLLEPHPYAFVHFLGMFKDCKRFEEGYDLWKWLVQQDDTCVSQAAYGAAIELMAYGNIATLAQLEELYMNGLERFPGVFAAYHLSPDAIVPDRSQPILIPGIPTVLIQGILTARLLDRNWKRAYLALDTILRLLPAQTPARFFEVFMAERSAVEAYTTFMVACRAGVLLNYTHVTTLFTKLRVGMKTAPSLKERIVLLRAVANAMYAYQAAGGKLQSLHVGVFIHCFELLLPDQTPGKDHEGHLAQLRNVIVLAAHDTLSRLLQAGFVVQIHPFEALISVAGKLHVPDLLTTAMQDVQAAGLGLGPVGTRSALTSAGLLRNKDLIEKLWSSIVLIAENEGSQIRFEDWVTFARACRRAGLTDYCREQLAKLSHTTTNKIEEQLIAHLESSERVPDQQPFEDMTPEELGAELEVLKEQMLNVEAVIMSGSRPDLRKSPFYMHIDPSTPILSSLENLRAVYDEATTDPHQPQPTPWEDSSNKPVLSSTGIPLDELRFKNWVTIREMMTDAEVYETHVSYAATKALNEGKPFKDYGKMLVLHDKTKTISTIEDLRQRFKDLRNPNSIPSRIIRKVGATVSDEKFRPMDYDTEMQTAKQL